MYYNHLFLTQIILFIMIWPLLTMLLMVRSIFADYGKEDVVGDISDPEDGGCEDGCCKSPPTKHELRVCV